MTLKIPDSESRLSTETFHHHPNKPLKEVEDEGSSFGFAPFQNLTLTEFQSHEFRPCTPGEEKEAQKQLHEALDPEIYQIKHRQKEHPTQYLERVNGFTPLFEGLNLSRPHLLKHNKGHFGNQRLQKQIHFNSSLVNLGFARHCFFVLMPELSHKWCKSELD